MRFLKTLSRAAIAGAVLLGLLATQVQAQPGSRLCGWVATNASDKIGFLVEKPRDNKKSCRARIDTIKRMLDQYRNWSGRKKISDKFVWQRIERVECEKIGAMGFQLEDGGTDICDRMKRQDYYIVSNLTTEGSKSTRGKTTFTAWGQYPRSGTSRTRYGHYSELTDRFMSQLGKRDYEGRHKRRSWER